MNKKLSLLTAIALCAPLFACGGTPASETPVDSSKPVESSTSSNSSRPVSSTPVSSNPPVITSRPGQTETEEYYAMPFNNYDGTTRSIGTEYKWDKGFTYKWEFDIPEARPIVTLSIGVKMSNSSHGDRTLFVNSSGADSSDTFESNSANNGTPRLSVKANDKAYTITNEKTYSENGLNTNSVVYLDLTSFPVVAGKNVIEVTTHAQTGYRLMVGGGDVRLYYTGDRVPEPFVPGDGEFKALTEFSAPVDMRTDDQKAFLEYADNAEAYAALTGEQMRNLFHVTGSGNNFSSPKPVHIEWTHGAKEEAFHYEVDLSKDATFPAADTIVYNVGKKKSVDIYNPMLGETYSYRIRSVYDSGDPDVSAVKSFSVLDTGFRNVHIDGLTNCRDLGGKVLENGSRIKPGMIFRTSALNSRASDATTVITAAGKDTMLNEFGVKSEIDLRGGSSGTGGESASASSTSDLGSTVAFKYSPMAYSGGKNLIYRNVEPLRKIFHTLADENNYPTFFHCRIGTDRTGALAMLINALLGLSEKEIYKDYLFSNFGGVGKQPVITNLDTPDDSVEAYVREIKAFRGATLAEKTYNFLRTIGVSAVDLDSIINILTDVKDGAKTTDPGVVTVVGVTGSDVTTSTDFRSAANYISLSGSKKATFSVDISSAKQDLYASIKCATTNTNLKAALKVTVDSTELALPETSFATAVAGLGGDYWVPIELAANQNIAAGSHTITVESLGTAVDISHIAVLGYAA